jgi:PII-like signaling protein
MIDQRPGKRIRIFVGEAEEWQGKPLYRAILERVQLAGAAGATVTRGIEGFGPEQHLKTERLPDIADNLPLQIEIVDSPEDSPLIFLADILLRVAHAKTRTQGLHVLSMRLVATFSDQPARDGHEIDKQPEMVSPLLRRGILV